MFKSKASTSKSFLRPLIIILIICIDAFLIGCSANYHADGKLIQNISADFRVGGFLGTSYVVKIKDDVLSYRATSSGIGSEWQKQTLSDADILSLESKLNELDVVAWDKKYIDPRIMDGTQWSIQFSSKKIKVKSSGNNKYPDTYTALINYISKVLLKGKPFG